MSSQQILDKCNFKINLIIIDDEGIVSHQNIENYVQGFSNCNSSPLVFENDEKYKFVFNPINIPSYAINFILQVAIEKNGKFYNPYFFPLYTLADMIENDKLESISNRAIRINVQKNDNGYTINRLDLYFTYNCIERLLESSSCNKLKSYVEYCKEYVLNN